MRALPLILAVLGLATPLTALAADREAVSGFYTGTAACPGGEVQIMLSLDIEADQTATGNLTVTPLVGAKVARGDYEVQGAINGDDWVSLKGPGKVAFAGAWFDEDGDDEPSILGDLAGSGCKSFNLIRQIDGPV